MNPSSNNQPIPTVPGGMPNQAPPDVPIGPNQVLPDPSVPRSAMPATTTDAIMPGPAAASAAAGSFSPEVFAEINVPPGTPGPMPTQGAFMPQQRPAPSMPQGMVAPGVPGTAAPGHTEAQAAKHANPNSTQNTLLIAEIRDGIVIMNDGSFRSVVMVKSVNFDLMSPQEQEAVEYSYQGFLNSLYFPIQIFIRSQKVDLQPYIAKLVKIRSEHDNMLLAMLMEDYINYIGQLSQQTNIMDKKFYVVIPFFPHVDVQKAITQSKTFFTGLFGLFKNKDQHITVNEADLEKAKTELRNRVQAVLQGLLQCGVQGLPLDTQELIELYYDTYNPDTATRQQLKGFNNLNADVITKGQGAAPQSHLQRELT